MTETIRVGISEIKIAEYPKKLRTAGLGSCVGIVLYDTRQKVAGMIHSMLPDYAIANRVTDQFPGKYVNKGIPTLLEEFRIRGIGHRQLKAKLAGGAEMFKISEQSISKIGYRNVVETKKLLAELSIPIISEETGGHFGRTIEFDTATNQLHIRTATQGERFI